MHWSHQDYANAMVVGGPDKVIQKLQRVHNTAARIVTRTRKYEHITPVLFDLHWLPVSFRIQFKVLVYTFEVVHGLAPSYLNELAKPYHLHVV